MKNLTIGTFEGPRGAFFKSCSATFLRDGSKVTFLELFSMYAEINIKVTFLELFFRIKRVFIISEIRQGGF